MTAAVWYHRDMDKIIITQPDALGGLWFIGWLFTIGYLKLSFGKGLLAIIVWPYYLGIHYRDHHHG